MWWACVMGDVLQYIQEIISFLWLLNHKKISKSQTLCINLGMSPIIQASSTFCPYLIGSVCDTADSPQGTSYINGDTYDQHTVVYGTHKSSKFPSKFSPYYLQGSVCDSADSPQGTSYINGDTCDQHTVVYGTHKSAITIKRYQLAGLW